MLIDMSSPAVGPLLRSFARAYGLVITTVMDRSLLLPVDELDELRINIQPPGIDMLNVVPDIVKFEKFDKVVILYDKSFGTYKETLHKKNTCFVHLSIHYFINVFGDITRK